MADGQHKLSRRALLGAACAAPLLRHSGLDPESISFVSAGRKEQWIPGRARNDAGVDPRPVTRWDRALARLRHAEAALTAAAGIDDDNLYDRLLGRLNKAMKRLLTLPAPNLPALADKLDLLVQHQAWELTFAEPALAAMRQDARRLACATLRLGTP
jgi:hypothetical protein